MKPKYDWCMTHAQVVEQVLALSKKQWRKEFHKQKRMRCPNCNKMLTLKMVDLDSWCNSNTNRWHEPALAFPPHKRRLKPSEIARSK